MSSNTKLQVVAAGHICLDIIPDIKHFQPGNKGGFFTPGKLLNTGKAMISTGGPVSNTGINLVRFGIQTALMGKIGSDPIGTLVQQVLKNRFNITEGFIVDDTAETSYTVVLAPGGLDRMFLHCPGANDTFCADDIDYDLVAQAQLFHLGYPPLMKKLYQNDGEELIKIYRKVKEMGITTSLDMSLPDPDSESGQVNWSKVLENLVPYVDIYLPSAEESLFMLNRDKFKEYAARGASNALDYITGDDLHELSTTLLKLGAAIVALKSGPRGYYVRTANRSRLEEINTVTFGDADSWTSREIWHPTFHVDEPPNATGSGDASIAGFLSGILKGQDFESAIRSAVGTGAASVRCPDALTGVLPWDELQAKLESGWETDLNEVTGQGWQPAGNNIHFGPAEHTS